MHFARGNCSHLKAKWDNHPSCLSCTSCLRSSPCSFCSVWSDKVWNLAEKRRLYSTRRLVMKQRRKQKKNRKRIQSDLSDTGSPDGSTAPLSFTARGRTHQGGSPGYQVFDWTISPPVTGQPVTVIQSPVNQSLVNQAHQLPVTGHPVTGQPVTSQPHHWSTSHKSTRHQSTRHQSFTLDYQSPVNISPVTHRSLYLNTYALSDSSHVSYCSNCRLPNNQNTGYEHSNVQEFPNPATSSRSSHLSPTSHRCRTQV